MSRRLERGLFTRFEADEVVELADGTQAVVVKPGRVWTTVRYRIPGGTGTEPIRTSKIWKVLSK